MRRMIRIGLWLTFLSISNANAQQSSSTANMPAVATKQAATPTMSASPTAAAAPTLVSGGQPTAPSPGASTITLACPVATNTQGAKCDWVEAAGAIAWPLVAIIALAILAFNTSIRRGLTRVLRRMKVSKVKGGPLELEFSAEAAKDVRASISEDLRDFELAARSEYDRQARALVLDQRLRSAVQALLQSDAFAAAATVRATVHVPDVVFSGSQMGMEAVPRSTQ